jgi:hypothetical protein
LSNTAETTIEVIPAKEEIAEDEQLPRVTLKVNKIEVKDQTEEVVFKLRKLNMLFQKQLEIKKYLFHLQQQKQLVQDKLAKTDCKCQMKAPSTAQLQHHMAQSNLFEADAPMTSSSDNLVAQQITQEAQKVKSLVCSKL